MDFRSLLQSMNTLSEGDVVHKGTYGTSHGSEDVRDQYGHRIGKVNKEKASEKPAEKRGRGRPKKGSDETGNVKKYDFTAFGGSGKDVKLPKWDKSKTTKHSLKEYIEEVEQNQQLDEAEQISIAPAQQNTQVIKKGNTVLGQVTNPQLANQIKQAIGKGEMSLNPGEEMNEAEVEESGLQAYLGNKKYGKEGMDALRKAGREGASKEKMASIRVRYDKTNESKEINESVSLSESPETLAHIISKFKNEVKRVMAGEEMDNDLYDALFDYYLSAGEMPYGVAKARTGDPYEWVFQRLQADLPDHVEEGQYTTHGMDSGPKSMEPSRIQTPSKPVENPTPWKVDPINAATDRAINFISGLRKPKQESTNPFESKDMKDVQLESWENQLNSLLTEGITVSSSTGQQGAPDSVSVNATDADADQLLQVLRQAGVGVFGGQENPMSGYGAPMNGPEGQGTQPEQSPTVVDDGDDMMALIKKMTGIDSGEQSGQSQPGTLEPAGEEGSHDYEEEGGEEQGEEQTDEGNAFTGALAKAKQDGVQPGEKMDVDGDGTEETPVKEDEMEEGNMFTGNLAKARAAGKEEADLDNDGDMEKVHEGEETCNECGMYESECGCDHEQMNEYANDAGGDAMADTELAKLKALLSMGGDMHKPKQDQTVGNKVKVSADNGMKISVEESILDWKKLSGIK